MNKKKIVNDPVYGFVHIPGDLVFDILEHPWFQRLRRINQLGLTSLVYPGALHTRFHHALGAMHLMQLALENIRFKGTEVSDHELQSACCAILLHDIGHGPFSHALENSLIEASHEELSVAFMREMSLQMGGKLDTAIAMFLGEYPRPFFHELISGQLDVDRLDYLRRDSFYTGVSEGIVGFDRIIKMMLVVDGHLVVEEKGIYSIEKFLSARRFMYWQVYLHKTVVAAEGLLINILRRARWVHQHQGNVFATPALKWFFDEQLTSTNLQQRAYALEQFAQLDDFDILAGIKTWANHPDKVLAKLCQGLIYRKLPAILIEKEKPGEQWLDQWRDQVKIAMKCDDSAVDYFLFEGRLVNQTYNPAHGEILICMKSNEIKPLTQASDLFSLDGYLAREVRYYLCLPKEVFDGSQAK